MRASGQSQSERAGYGWHVAARPSTSAQSLAIGDYNWATDVEKPYARLLGEAAWIWSRKQGKVVFGVAVVLLVWTDGQVHIPLALRRWHKGGPSKFALALALLSYARNRLCCQPQFVLFDSWYPSQKLLKRMRDYGGYYICQRKKNRRCEGQRLSRYLCQPYRSTISPCAW